MSRVILHIEAGCFDIVPAKKNRNDIASPDHEILLSALLNGKQDGE